VPAQLCSARAGRGHGDGETGCQSIVCLLEITAARPADMTRVNFSQDHRRDFSNARSTDATSGRRRIQNRAILVSCLRSGRSPGFCCTALSTALSRRVSAPPVANALTLWGDWREHKGNGMSLKNHHAAGIAILFAHHRAPADARVTACGVSHAAVCYRGSRQFIAVLNFLAGRNPTSTARQKTAAMNMYGGPSNMH